MAKLNLDRMSYAELADLRAAVDRQMIEKQGAERVALFQKMADIASAAGLTLDQVLGKGRKGKGSVAVKYRDPKNPAYTWTGRGRMPSLDGCRHQGQQGEARGFSDLTPP